MGPPPTHNSKIVAKHLFPAWILNHIECYRILTNPILTCLLTLICLKLSDEKLTFKSSSLLWVLSCRVRLLKFSRLNENFLPKTFSPRNFGSLVEHWLVRLLSLNLVKDSPSLLFRNNGFFLLLFFSFNTSVSLFSTNDFFTPTKHFLKPMLLFNDHTYLNYCVRYLEILLIFQILLQGRRYSK